MPRSLIDSLTGPTYQFIALNGEIQGMTTVVEEITRAGVDGQAYRKVAKRGRPFEMVGDIDCFNADDVVSIYNELKDLQGTVVSLYDDHGSLASDVVVLDVQKIATRPIAAAVGGTIENATRLLSVRFTMVIAHPNP